MINKSVALCQACFGSWLHYCVHSYKRKHKWSKVDMLPWCVGSAKSEGKSDLGTWVHRTRFLGHHRTGIPAVYPMLASGHNFWI